MRHSNRTTWPARAFAVALGTLAVAATAQVPASMPDPEKADEQAKRLAVSPFRRILEAGRVEVKLRREVEAHAPVAPPPRRVTAAVAPPKPQASRPAQAETPAPAPAPLLALAPPSTTTIVPAATAAAGTERLWTAFNGATATVDGGTIQGLIYSEQPGDAALGDITVRATGVLNVTGQFNTRGGSQWAGVGIVLVAPKPVVATEFKTLRVHLAGYTVSQLRLRLVGDDPVIGQKGCYPIRMLPVSPQVTEYRIELSQFAPPDYCGSQGVDVKTTLQSLTAIEIADAPEPVSERAVSFNVGTLSLIK
ncbi:hypothetical protein [Piscinibacter terrae]|uniref:Uncharacterized protein n=1 Tax=Piscinibacter terrae TaxID=2496871 RepID=A0A3N7HRJ4_9BURK|nr:hypothetical protein [Albitalea terrae]RQP24870.1 hypothetical protein DZC73_08345 [Albitalea terrae]